MKKLCVLVVLTMTVSACATLASKEERQTQFIDQTKVSKATAFNKAMGYVAKSFVDSNAAIRMKDAESGQIIVRGNVECNVLRQAGDVNGYSLAYNMDFQAKDNKVRLVFEDLEMVDKVGASVQWANNQITSKEKVEQVKSCLEPIRAGVMKAINGSSDSW